MNSDIKLFPLLPWTPRKPLEGPLEGSSAVEVLQGGLTDSLPAPKLGAKLLLSAIQDRKTRIQTSALNFPI